MDLDTAAKAGELIGAAVALVGVPLAARRWWLATQDRLSVTLTPLKGGVTAVMFTYAAGPAGGAFRLSAELLEPRLSVEALTGRFDIDAGSVQPTAVARSDRPMVLDMTRQHGASGRYASAFALPVSVSEVRVRSTIFDLSRGRVVLRTTRSARSPLSPLSK